MLAMSAERKQRQKRKPSVRKHPCSLLPNIKESCCLSTTCVAQATAECSAGCRPKIQGKPSAASFLHARDAFFKNRNGDVDCMPSALRFLQVPGFGSVLFRQGELLSSQLPLCNSVAHRLFNMILFPWPSMAQQHIQLTSIASQSFRLISTGAAAAAAAKKMLYLSATVAVKSSWFRNPLSIQRIEAFVHRPQAYIPTCSTRFNQRHVSCVFKLAQILSAFALPRCGCTDRKTICVNKKPFRFSSRVRQLFGHVTAESRFHKAFHDAGLLADPVSLSCESRFCSGEAPNRVSCVSRKLVPAPTSEASGCG